MNLSSIIVLLIIAVCFICAVKNIKKNRCGGKCGCGSCNNSSCCNKNRTKEK